jgi:flagellar biosynthesis chaperone FliJ
MADPLATLARLRRLEVAQARKQLAERNLALAAAEARHDTARAAPGREAGTAAPADYAAWLPLGLAERERAARAAQHSANQAQMARDALAVQRTAERQVELLREQKAATAVLKARRKAQALLDEFGSRR